MAPMSFEKKTFYPSPLASLNRLTLNLETPYGHTLKNHNDVLNIKNIILGEQDNSLTDITMVNGFSYSDYKYVIEITTHNYFNNRVFKLGDNIKFLGFDSLVPDKISNSFINRDEGHFIINYEKEDATGGKNQGYINKLYISAPGDFNETAVTTATIFSNLVSKVSLPNGAEVALPTDIYTSSVTTSTSNANVITPGSTKPSTVLIVGDKIKIGTDERIVLSIDDDNNKFVVDSVFGTGASSRTCSLIGKGLFIDSSSSNTCKIINNSIQTHFVFKIITREEDITAIMNTSNI